ncbi:hypothetical protein [Planktothricoides raciborskii]|uniref:Uncharacterized protein n=2 Tax=Planktothricoides TaxID=132607 RepID=A0AAU8JI77_9CYAN
MNNSEEHDFSPLPAEQIFLELERFMVQLSAETDRPWFTATTLCKLFADKYHISLKAVMKQKGYDCLKSFLTSSQRFSIYNHPDTQEFYVAAFSAINPNLTPEKTTTALSIKYTIKRPWKVDGRLLDLLKSEEYQETPKPQEIPKPQNSLFVKPAGLPYKPKLIDEIKSRVYLEFVLLELVKSLTINHPQNFTTIGALSEEFSKYYRQPIRGIFRSLSIQIKLVNFLKNIPELSVKQVDDGWQITIEPNVI